MSKIKFQYYLLIILALLLSGGQLIWSQEKALDNKLSDTIFVRRNSLIIFPDTTLFIRNDTVLVIPSDMNYKLKKISGNTTTISDSSKSGTKENKLTRALYNVIFTSSDSNSNGEDFQSPEKTFLPYKGMIISRIRLKQVDVLAGSIMDTSITATDQFSKLLNSIHVKTRKRIIYNNLLFHRGDSLDAYVLADNERILRSLPFIEDARILVVPVAGDKNKVEIVVITKDLFSIGVNPTFIDVNKYRFDLFDRNLMGWGSELRYTNHYNSAEELDTGHELKYSLTNIRGSFINARFSYSNIFGDKFLGAIFEKAFLTPQVKYAGSLDLGRISEEREESKNGEIIAIPYIRYYLDTWLGRSFQIGKEDSRKNIIIAGRYRGDDLAKRPFVSPDSNYFYHNGDLFLGGISYTKINYYKSSLILSFGPTEDVPVGYFYNLTAGISRDEFIDKPYLELDFLRSHLIDNLGYLSYQMSIGGFIYHDRFREGVLRLNSNYFTPLMKKNKFRFRHLAALDFTIGLNRISGEYINLQNEIRGLSSEVKGTGRLALSLESIAFTPWNLYGFRFAPYIFADMGFIGSSQKLITNENFFGSFGIGVRIRNESLVFETLELRIGYFPRTSEGTGEWQLDFSSRDPSYFNNIGYSRPGIIGFE